MNNPINLNKIINKYNTDKFIIYLISNKYNGFKLDGHFNQIPRQSKYANRIVQALSEISDYICFSITGHYSYSEFIDAEPHENILQYIPQDNTNIKNLSSNENLRYDFSKEITQSLKSNLSKELYDVNLKNNKSFINLLFLLEISGNTHLADPKLLEHIILNSMIFQKKVIEDFFNE